MNEHPNNYRWLCLSCMDHPLAQHDPCWGNVAVTPELTDQYWCECYCGVLENQTHG